jgi:hypothetical protein
MSLALRFMELSVLLLPGWPRSDKLRLAAFLQKWAGDIAA